MYNIILKNKGNYSLIGDNLCFMKYTTVLIIITKWFFYNLTTIIKLLLKSLVVLQRPVFNTRASIVFNKSVNCKMKLFTHNKGDRQIFMFKLKSMWSPDKFKAFFCPALKYRFFNHIATSPDTQISYPAPNNTSLCENRTFLLTILKQVQESL